MANLPQLESDLNHAVRGEVRFDAYSRALYSTDASIFRIEPMGVVIPRDGDDVAVGSLIGFDEYIRV